MDGRAVFLDRDGVLNHLIERDGQLTSPRSIEEFVLVDDAQDSVQRLRAAGFKVFVVTNQPDIARGHMSREALEEMLGTLKQDVGVDDVAYCGHDDDDVCACRKPKPGMLHALADRWSVDLSRSVMVGDTWRDVEAGRAASCSTVLVGAAESAPAADFAAANLREAVEIIVTRMS